MTGLAEKDYNNAALTNLDSWAAGVGGSARVPRGFTLAVNDGNSFGTGSDTAEYASDGCSCITFDHGFTFNSLRITDSQVKMSYEVLQTASVSTAAPNHTPLNLVRLNSASAAPPTKGPLLFLHDIYSDWYKFMDVGCSIGSETPGPIKLREDGYDVYLATRRGGVHQNKCESEYCMGNEETNYWNGPTIKQIAENDVDLLIDLIMSFRTSSGLGCKKVTLVSHGIGALEALHVANMEDAENKIDRLVNLAPCAVPDLDWIELPQRDQFNSVRRLSAEPE